MSKAKSQPMRGYSTRVGDGLPHKYETRLEKLAKENNLAHFFLFVQEIDNISRN
jgi:hypothetical protein